MNDSVQPLALEELSHTPPVGNVDLDETESTVRRKPRQPRLFQGNVVVVVEVVQAKNVVAARKEPLRDMHPDESRRARDQDFQMTVPCVCLLSLSPRLPRSRLPSNIIPGSRRPSNRHRAF